MFDLCTRLQWVLHSGANLMVFVIFFAELHVAGLTKNSASLTFSACKHKNHPFYAQF